MKTLTAPRRRLLLYIAAYQQLHGILPTVRELRGILRTTSTNYVREALDVLRELGFVSWKPGAPRTLRLTPAGRAVVARPTITVPLLVLRA